MGGIERATTRQIRCAWEIYAVTERGMSAGEALRAFDNWMDSVGEAAVREVGGVEYEYGDALREENGTVWDHEPCGTGPWTAEEMAEKNREHIADMGKHYDGSRIVQVRRVTLGPWEVVADV